MLKISENNYTINGFNVDKDVLLAVRPNAPVLTGDNIRCEYDGKGLHTLSNGKKQTKGSKSWSSANTILNDSKLQADIEAHLESLKPTPPVPTDLELALEARQSKYIAKGWSQPWDLLDDILNQLDAAGITLQAKVDRDSIKTAHPKPNQGA